MQWRRLQLVGNVKSETLSVEPQPNFLVLDLELGPAFRTVHTANAQLVMGPIIGAVTETTASIAAETTKTQQLTCTVVNQLTNVSVCYSAWLRGLQKPLSSMTHIRRINWNKH